MTWDDLRFLLAVARKRTLAAAGRELGVDPTTVGRRIVAIEAELSARLFDRTGDGFFVTHAGEIALARAQAMELEALALEREIAGSDARVEGPVRITALDALIDLFLVPRLPRLLNRHPGLEITLSSDMRLLDLARREADVALRASPPRHPDAVGRKLGRQATGAYASRDLQGGADPPVIGLPRALDGTSLAQSLRTLFPKSRMAARGNSEGHILSLIRAGLGVGIVDCFAGDADPLLRRFLPEPVRAYDMWAVTHVDMRQAPRVRAVVDFLAAIFAEEADLLAGRMPAGTPES
jgi:DNA-binding transcriptional LysR family regulator